MGNTTQNTQALNRRDVYSDVVMQELLDGALPEGITREVVDFPNGSTLFIPTFGEVVVVEVMEDQEVPVSALDTGRIQLTVTEHKGAGLSMTDEEREDGHYIADFDAATPMAMTRGVSEVYESDLLNTGEIGQTQGDANAINGYAHRWVASGAAGQLGISDFAYAKASVLKAKSPEMGMIAIIDPISELSFNRLTNLVNVSNNPRFEGMVETGFGKGKVFLKNILGWDVWMSNRLPRVAAETIDTTANGGVPAPEGDAAVQAAGKAITDAYAAQFMVLGDDMARPYMSVWRRKPQVTYYRDEPRRKDVYYITARYGFAMQRPQTLCTVLASTLNY